jgi:hypothetical protein
VAPPGNQAANGENKHQPKYREKPVYSTQTNQTIFWAVAVLPTFYPCSSRAADKLAATEYRIQTNSAVSELQNGVLSLP